MGWLYAFAGVAVNREIEGQRGRLRQRKMTQACDYAASASAIRVWTFSEAGLLGARSRWSDRRVNLFDNFLIRSESDPDSRLKST